MTPQAAYERLCATGPFDDPHIVHYPTRWYFDQDGVLAKCGWRSSPIRFPDFKKPICQDANLSREGERRYESWLESLKDHGP